MNDRNSLQLHLQDLNLDNVDALEGLKLTIQVMTLHIVQMTILRELLSSLPLKLLMDPYHGTSHCMSSGNVRCRSRAAAHYFTDLNGIADLCHSCLSAVPHCSSYTQNAWRAIQATVCVCNSFCKCFCNSSCPKVAIWLITLSPLGARITHSSSDC